MSQSARDLYIFEGCSPGEIDYFLLMTDIVTFSKGETLMREGDKSDGKAYFIEDWSVTIERKGKVITTLRAGGFFWEFALIIREPRTATVKTMEETRCRVFHRDEFRVLLDRSKIWVNVRKEIIRRIRENALEGMTE